MPVEVKPSGFNLVVEGFSSQDERWIGTLLVLSNGRIGVRGEFELAGSKTNYALMHGLYNSIPIWRRELVALPSVNNAYLVNYSLDSLTSLRRVLDMYNGVLHVKAVFNDGTRYESEHLVHKTFKNLYARRIVVESKQEVSLVLPVEQSYNPFLYGYTWSQHLELSNLELSRSSLLLAYRVRDSGEHVYLRVHVNTENPSSVEVFRTRDSAGFLLRGNTINVTEYVTITTTKPGHLEEGSLKWDEVKSVHTKAWNTLWSNIGLDIEGDEELSGKIIFYTYHLLQLVDEEAGELMIPARGLHGLGYRGHVFWDTDLYLLPFAVLVYPEMGEKILNFRCRTLGKAVKYAAESGYAGARYPWESVDDGEESTPRYYPIDLNTCRCVDILTGEKEIHVTADVALAVDLYWRATGDEEFLKKCGLRILVETARFWVSRVVFDDVKKGFVIKDVIGPDEYHVGVDNNYFTNLLAYYNIKRAYELVAERLGRDEYAKLFEDMGITEKELEKWRSVFENMYLGRVVDGVIEQFEGYFDLSIDFSNEGGIRRVDVTKLGEVQKSKMIKQADVVLALLIREVLEGVEPGILVKNYEYYAPRTTHESSLSLPVYATMAFILDRPEALELFKRSLDIDLKNYYGNTQDGFHVASAGGIWYAILFGILGLRVRGGDLVSNPKNIPGLKITLNIKWRGKTMRISNSRSD